MKRYVGWQVALADDLIHWVPNGGASMCGQWWPMGARPTGTSESLPRERLCDLCLSRIAEALDREMIPSHG